MWPNNCQDNLQMIKKKREVKLINASDYVTVTEAAQLRGVSRAAIHELIQRGRLKSEKMLEGCSFTEAK